MGNAGSEFQNTGEANLVLLLVRYWSNLIDAADNFSTISRLSKTRRFARTPSITSYANQESKYAKKGKKKKSRPPEVIEEEDFDWQEKTKEELHELKGSVPWKEFDTGWDTIRSPKMRRKFRKRRKKPAVSNEMWTMSEKNFSLEDDSSEKSEKMFWKTPTPAIEDNNMLWRTFKDPDSSESGIFSESSIVKSEIVIREIGEIETLGRKTRLSRWNFLRQGNAVPSRVPLKREASFRSRKPTVRRTVQSGMIRRASVKGVRGLPPRRGLVLKTSRGDWMNKIGKERAELEDDRCSCCSCEEYDSYATRCDEMAPNSEDSMSGGWRNEMPGREPQRPPVYNPEDYALSLKKWGRKDNRGMLMPLSVTQSTASLDSIGSSASKSQKLPASTKSSVSSVGKGKENSVKGGPRDMGSVVLQPPSAEMSLRQFSSMQELLAKLKTDLQLAFPSFVQEFVGDPVDGVTLLLELLRTVQQSQAQQQQQQKCPPQIQRRALLDEHSCLICLQHCLRCTDAARRLAKSPAGLFTLAVCIMSNVTKSRVIALELLTKACEPPANGHTAVSDALSTLRLRFGEPVRFRFLLGMLNSAGAVELLTAGMKFINAFLETAPSVQQRVYIQAELEQAGFLADTLRKTLPSHSEGVKSEINRFEKNFIDVTLLQKQANESISLREKVQLLEKRIYILQEEKGVLKSLEQCLKDRCTELEEEMSTQTSTTGHNRTARIEPYNSGDKGESTPAEDEGISSSEHELSQDEEPKRAKPPAPEPKKPPRRSLMPLEEPIKPPRNLPPSKPKETEEDTSIEEVLEELHSIAQQVDTKTYQRNTKLSMEDRTRTFTRSRSEKRDADEVEIVPSVILPQPPRRAKSLVHIFLSGRECEDKNQFFDEESDSESSDSLLTRERRKEPFRQSLRSAGSFNGLDSPKEVRSAFEKVENWREKSLEKNFPQRWPERETRQETKPSFQERNIDEEAKRRSNILPPPPAAVVAKRETSRRNESPFVRRTQRFVPVPVKRSQTFHTQEKRPPEIKPKPKMGVSGLDFKREPPKYQNIDYKNRYSKKMKDKNEKHRGSLDELQFAAEREEAAKRNPRSISLERVDASIESFVNVLSDDAKRAKEIRNIGPRSRRSLAESSLFTPPQPKQRTSLSRQSSSSTPLTLPVEIIPPATRAPPDGSSSPLDYESPRKSQNDESPIYATPNKPSKLQKFFGNPKFETSVGDTKQQNYFESNYACLERPNKNAVKALLQPHPQKASQSGNFYLNTYQARPSAPALPSSPPPSSAFVAPFIIKRATTNNAGMYTGSREEICSPTPTETSSGSGRLSAGSSRAAARLSDSISGLY